MELPFQIYKWVDGQPYADVGGIARPISDPQSLAQYGITDYSTLPYHPATGMAGPVRGGTTGGGMSLQDLVNQQNTYSQQAQPTQPAQQPVQQPVQQVVQQPVSPQSQPVQQAQQQATGTMGQKQYVKYAGSPDVFDRAGRYVSAQEAAGITNFFSQVEEMPAPRPDVKVESDFARLAGQSISQAVKDAIQPSQGAQTVQGVQQAQTPTQQPATPAPVSISGQQEQKPYVQYQGSPDVFERATGKYISSEEASKIPDFFQQVEQATAVRPGVQTEEDFAKLAKTNLKLQQSGATTNPQDFQDNPLKAFQDTYQQIWSNLGLGSVKEQITSTLKSIKGVDDQMIDAIATVNDNPWISEAERSRQITKLQSKYESKNKANTENLKLLQGLFETGQKEAQFVSSNALEAYNKDRAFDEAEKIKRMELAEKMTDVSKYIKEVDGGLFNVLTNDWIVPREAGVGSDYKPPTSYQEWDLAGQPGTYADWLKEQNIKAPTTAQQTVAEYAARLEQANPTIESLTKDIQGMNIASFLAQIKLPSAFQSDAIQQYMQSARNFINAKLRRESGAVIAETEFKEARQQYLPQPGDSETVLAQKKANRDLVYSSLKKAAGNAYQSVDELMGKSYAPGSVIVNNKVMYQVDEDGETLIPIGSAL